MSTVSLADEAAVRQAVSLYCSFDRDVRADRGGGGLEFATRTGKPGAPETYLFTKGYDARVFRIAKDKGRRGGALEVVDVLPDSGRIFLPVKGNLAYKPGGWGGAVSMWINTDPNTMLKTSFCDPVQITQKGANNGGIWCDFTHARPRRNLRMGIFPGVPDGQKPLSEDAPDAPLVTMPGVAFQSGEWHHLVISWENFDTGKPDGRAVFYVDGKRIGAIENRPLAMNWDVDKAGIFIAVNFIGLMDDFAAFNRALTAGEVTLLQRMPDLLK